MACWDSNNWSGKSRLEKTLVLFVVILSCAVLVLFISLVSRAHDEKVCNTSECVHASSHILQFVDPTLDPCEDFYDFVCGSFAKSSKSTAIQSLEETSKNRLKDLVIKDQTQPLIHTLTYQRKFFHMCMDADTATQQLSRILYELTLTWKEKGFNWIESMKVAKSMGLYYDFFIGFASFEDIRNNRTILTIVPPDCGKKTPLRKLKFTENFINKISHLTSILGITNLGVTTELSRTLQFCEQFLYLLEDACARKENESNIIQIKNIRSEFTQIDWLDFFRNVTENPLTATDEILWDDRGYFRDLYYLFLRTPKKIQENFVLWNIIFDNLPLLSDELRLLFSDSQSSERKLSRQDICYKISNALFPCVTGAEYVNRYTSNLTISHVTEIIDYIKYDLEKMLSNTDWMDLETKSYALDLLKNLSAAIGWTDFVFNRKAFEDYLNYNITELEVVDNAVDMKRNIRRRQMIENFHFLREDHNITIESYLQCPSLSVNAYYVAVLNKIILPASILQGIIFNPNRPNYMNFGALGSIIGHELTHGFIYQEAESDKDKTVEWYTNGTLKNFQKVIQCVVEGYDNYTGHDLNAGNGSSTFEENLADDTGKNLAYIAYQNWVSDHGIEDLLPGLHYTPNQIFWIMTNTYLCQSPATVKYGEDNNLVANKTDVHASKKYRVNNPLQNSIYFAKDYNCPVGSKMNPAKKCRVFL